MATPTVTIGQWYRRYNRRPINWADISAAAIVLGNSTSNSTNSDFSISNCNNVGDGDSITVSAGQEAYQWG